MKKLATCAAAILFLAGGARAQGQPNLPASQKGHEWLKQLEEEWVTETEAQMGPGQPPLRFKGTEVIRSLGGFWTIGEIKSDLMGMTGIMTLGYDTKAKKYVGTWVCSVEAHFWRYEGALDASGKVLTLNTEGPNMADPGKTTKMKDVIEIKSKDHKVLRSYMQTNDGKWVQFMKMDARRK